MLNKILLPLFLLLGSFFVYGQFTIKSNNKGWVLVNSNNGGIIRDVVSYQLDMNGNQNANIKKWSVVAKITSSIRNGENPDFPVDKIKLIFNNITFQQYYLSQNPTLSQIGIIQNEIKMANSNSYLIQNSPLTINVPSGKYGSMVLGYDVKIEGGNYLNAHKSWNNYQINFEVSLLDEYSKVISTSSFPLSMMISPNGNYEAVPTLSIELNTDVKNANMSFYRMKDYVGGVVAEYPNGLKIKSDTDYEIQVSSTNDKFLSTDGNLDVDIINVKLKDVDTKSVSSQIKLSTIPQKIFSGKKNTTEKKFDIIYSTNPSDTKILKSKPGLYTTTLLYTISPL